VAQFSVSEVAQFSVSLDSLAGIAGKAKEKLHVSIFSNLLYGLLIGQAKPLLDEQRA
jgi:hypothetical protein